ncbi:polysaccharide deacetylase family protein [Aliarcobacter butzleri]|uniref:polysaccharide deacetylase family protein n=1 Tax=Aliarcobacter butzleri TaxID=28197 RepID=UPI00125FE569|nr:polysaccharide deacetylase family protein [Aliarcobacter butzleri]MCT7626124.1 polysaccharide deacetylase family protein [Aliarcobacter butzleri]MCT7644157.1 polysaccharide deacetylase family protein [Aliarcobacter butzleri]
MNFKKIIKNIVGEIYYNGYYKYIKPKGNRILIYHAFGSKLKHDSYGISINPKLFEEHLKFLKNNYKLLPLNHDTLDNKFDTNSVSITIDDGYKDNLVAVELMEKYQIPYTIYISTGLIDKEQYLTTQDLEDIAKLDLCTLGTHSVNHVHLSRLNKDEQYKELYDSKLFLENIIGKKVIDFSYPYGDYNDSSKNIADELYEIIATSHIGINTINCDKKMLKRIEIIASDNVQSLRKKIDGYYDFL